jgi:hypothetical protein
VLPLIGPVGMGTASGILAVSLLLTIRDKIRLPARRRVAAAPDVA